MSDIRDGLPQPSEILLDIFGDDHREHLEHATTIIPFQCGIAVMAGITHFLRQRFDAVNGLPWAWQDDFNTTGIVIELAYNEDSEKRGGRPGIYVDRMRTQHDKKGGHRPTVVHGPRTGNEIMMTWDRVRLRIKSVSQKRLESAILAELTYTALQEGFKDLERAAWIRDVSAVTMGATSPYTLDDKCWETPVDVELELEKIWFRLPRGVKLREVLVTLTGPAGEQQILVPGERDDL